MVTDLRRAGPSLAQALLGVLVAHFGLFAGAALAATVSTERLVLAIGSSIGFWIGILVAVTRVTGWRDLLGSWAKRVKVRWLIGAAMAGVTLQLLMPVLYWPVLRLTNTDAEDLERPARELLDASNGTVAMVMLFLIVVVGAPLFEELCYRGLVYAGLSGHGRTVAVVGSAVLFAAMHLQPLQFVGLVLFGLLAGWLRDASGSIWPSVGAHAAFNAVTLVLLSTAT